ncbi:MAG: thiamine phosphate synthase [Acidobacteria bacterium]|nr:MAG: thiamine phosphate synthase [Acidobacteriota bacterium]
MARHVIAGLRHSVSSPVRDGILMKSRCLLYYITDRRQFPGTEESCRAQLVEKIAEAAGAGVDYIQLREKDLPTRDLEMLAREALALIRESSNQSAGRSPTRFLINSLADVALATEADGVHLRSDDVPASDVRRMWTSAETHAGGGARSTPVIAVSCHTLTDVQAAQQNGADFAVFGPVFEKKDAPARGSGGLEALRQACEHKIPVLALGGVSLDNAAACVEAGAAGIAAIRLFQQNDVDRVVERLREVATS